MSSKTANKFGGDYYDFIENDNNDLYAICGDATGHGVVSGIMVSLQMDLMVLIWMIPQNSRNLNSIIKRVNFGRLRLSLVWLK